MSCLVYFFTDAYFQGENKTYKAEVGDLHVTFNEKNEDEPLLNFLNGG